MYNKYINKLKNEFDDATIERDDLKIVNKLIPANIFHINVCFKFISILFSFLRTQCYCRNI